MKKKRIYAILEIKERELLAKTLFAIEMAKSGHSVVIGKKSSLYRYQKYFQSGIFYFKGMGKKNVEPMQEIKKNGHKIVGFDEEGLVVNQVSGIADRVNKNCLNMVDFFFTVGAKQQKNTLKVYPDFKKKIYEIGNPRFDLLKKKNNKFYRNEIQALKKKYGNFVFFATNFTMLNNYFFSSNQIMKKPSVKNNLHIFERDLENQKRIKKKLLYFFNYFPKKYPNINIVIKPHPVERKDYWIKLLKKIKCKNLMLADQKFNTNSYLLASEFNVGSNCHTSLESYLCEKPTINIRANKKDNIQISKLIRTVSGKEVLHMKELEKIISDWFNKNKKFRNELSKREKSILYHNVKNIKQESSFFFEKIISTINIQPKIKKDKYSNFFYLKFFSYLRKIKNLYYSFRSTKDELDFFQAKFPGLKLDEFRFYVKEFSNVLNYDFKKLSVKEIYPGCFCLEKL